MKEVPAIDIDAILIADQKHLQGQAYRFACYWPDQGQSSGNGGRLVWYDFRQPGMLLVSSERRIPNLRNVWLVPNSEQFVLELYEPIQENLVSRWIKGISWLKLLLPQSRTTMQLVDFGTEDVLLEKNYSNVPWVVSPDQRVLLLAERDSEHGLIRRVQAYAVPLPPRSFLHRRGPFLGGWFLALMTWVAAVTWKGRCRRQRAL